MRRRTAIAIAGAGAMALASEASHHWSYAGQMGPSHWAELDPKFAACGNGKAQSPIDIQVREVRGERLPALAFDYKSTPLHIVDNGHTVQVDADPGSWLRIGDDRYQLIQFHFHHPSEERINGKGADMVAHFVHRDASGGLAVVAVFLNTGEANATVDELWSHLPKKDHQAAFKDVLINPAALLPRELGYFTYSGSLTTPPCSEGVRWIILKSPRTLSKDEIATFTARYPNDARPVQKLNGRLVLASN